MNWDREVERCGPKQYVSCPELAADVAGEGGRPTVNSGGVAGGVAANQLGLPGQSRDIRRFFRSVEFGTDPGPFCVVQVVSDSLFGGVT